MAASSLDSASLRLLHMNLVCATSEVTEEPVLAPGHPIMLATHLRITSLREKSKQLIFKVKDVRIDHNHPTKQKVFFVSLITKTNRKLVTWETWSPLWWLCICTGYHDVTVEWEDRLSHVRDVKDEQRNTIKKASPWVPHQDDFCYHPEPRSAEELEILHGFDVDDESRFCISETDCPFIHILKNLYNPIDPFEYSNYENSIRIIKPSEAKKMTFDTKRSILSTSSPEIAAFNTPPKRQVVAPLDLASSLDNSKPEELARTLIRQSRDLLQYAKHIAPNIVTPPRTRKTKGEPKLRGKGKEVTIFNSSINQGQIETPQYNTQAFTYTQNQPNEYVSQHGYQPNLENSTKQTLQFDASDPNQLNVDSILTLQDLEGDQSFLRLQEMMNQE